jgi:PAS domain S-box-containing protein
LKEDKIAKSEINTNPEDGESALIKELRQENKKLNREARRLQDIINRKKKMDFAISTLEAMHRAEQEKEKTYLRLLLENTSDIIILLDKDGRFVYCSDEFLKLTKIENFGLINGRLFKQVYEDLENPAFVKQALERFRLIQLGQKIVIENAAIDFSKSGNYRNYSINSAPIMNENGRFDGALVIYHDITNLLRVEADERSRIMFNAIPQACTFWDTEGRLVDCNEETLRLFRIAAKEEFIERFYDLSAAVQAEGKLSRTMMKELIAETLRTGRQKCEWMHRTISGEWLPTELTLVRVNWRNEYRLVGHIRDLREIKASEERRREAYERSRELEVQTRAAQVASEAKSKFLASMSHEIRTPMNAIIGMSDLMRTDNMDAAQQGFFRDIKKMSKTLLQIINDILDISKIEAGKLALIPVHFNILELYDNICSMSRFSAESKDLEWRHSFDTTIPHIIYGDDVRMRQVISNLINNAIKYTREGYVDFSVSRTIKNRRDYLVFRIQDSGIGIREEDFSKVFAPFQQLNGKENHGIEGAGLGLSITKELVEMMDGEIEFESEYGAGSVFTVLLPLVEGNPARIAKEMGDVKVKASADVKVLVVDDNHINRKIALAFLEVHHIHADIAESGVEAIQKLKESPYDLVFMDHMMPGMDGIETTQRIRNSKDERLKTMPIIALSANAVSGAREQFLKAGMNDFIPKPIDAGELNRKLSQWLPADKISQAEIPDREELSPAANQERDLPGVIDREAGFNNSGGEEALYHQILICFKEDHADDYQKIRAALEAGDVSLGYRLAHGLKSNAALIGATELRRSAFELERALAHKNIINARQRLPKLETELGAVMKELASLVRKLPEPDPAASGAPHEHPPHDNPPHDNPPHDNPPDREKVMDLIRRLRPLLESGNTGSLALLGEIKYTLSTPGGKTVNLIKQIEDFEFNQALEILSEIQEEILGGVFEL